MEIQIEATIDVMFGDDDIETWRIEVMDKPLPWWGKLNKGKYGQNLHDHQFFSFSLLGSWDDGEGGPSLNH